MTRPLFASVALALAAAQMACSAPAPVVDTPTPRPAPALAADATGTHCLGFGPRRRAALVLVMTDMGSNLGIERTYRVDRVDLPSGAALVEELIADERDDYVLDEDDDGEEDTTDDEVDDQDADPRLDGLDARDRADQLLARRIAGLNRQVAGWIPCGELPQTEPDRRWSGSVGEQTIEVRVEGRADEDEVDGAWPAAQIVLLYGDRPRELGELEGGTPDVAEDVLAVYHDDADALVVVVGGDNGGTLRLVGVRLDP